MEDEAQPAAQEGGAQPPASVDSPQQEGAFPGHESAETGGTGSQVETPSREAEQEAKPDGGGGNTLFAKLRNLEKENAQYRQSFERFTPLLERLEQAVQQQQQPEKKASNFFEDPEGALAAREKQLEERLLNRVQEGTTKDLAKRDAYQWLLGQQGVKDNPAAEDEIANIIRNDRRLADNLEGNTSLVLENAYLKWASSRRSVDPQKKAQAGGVQASAPAGNRQPSLEELNAQVGRMSDAEYLKQREALLRKAGITLEP